MKKITRTIETTKALAKIFTPGTEELTIRNFEIAAESRPKMVQKIIKSKLNDGEILLEVQILETTEVTYEMLIETFLANATKVESEEE